MSDRAAVAFANYPGDQTANTRTTMGPNTLGEYLYQVSATYDAGTDKTRLGFSYMPPREQVGHLER